MRPVIVAPMNDPKGLLFPHLEASTPQLKELFEAAYVSIQPATRSAQPAYCQWLAADSFFHVFELPQDTTSIAENFLPLYTYAAANCPPAQILHLCFIDRVAYALQSEYQERFRRDLQDLGAQMTPMIYQRSPAAWATHPDNYRELEQMVTRVGELLFGKSMDFAWCHLALQADELAVLLPNIHAGDFSFEAEMVLHLRDRIHTQAVDWLAWEDPFIEKRDPQRLKEMREASIAESCKRLAYVAPMLQLLKAAACA